MAIHNHQVLFVCCSFVFFLHKWHKATYHENAAEINKHQNRKEEHLCRMQNY